MARYTFDDPPRHDPDLPRDARGPDGPDAMAPPAPLRARRGCVSWGVRLVIVLFLIIFVVAAWELDPSRSRRLDDERVMPMQLAMALDQPGREFIFEAKISPDTGAPEELRGCVIYTYIREWIDDGMHETTVLADVRPTLVLDADGQTARLRGDYEIEKPRVVDRSEKKFIDVDRVLEGFKADQIVLVRGIVNDRGEPEAVAVIGQTLGEYQATDPDSAAAHAFATWLMRIVITGIWLVIAYFLMRPPRDAPAGGKTEK